jgi:cell wall-associated NlpC family hydrolase
VTISAVMEIQTRIATIQQRFAPPTAVGGVLGAGATTAASSTSSTGTFAGDLAAATSQYQDPNSISSTGGVQQASDGSTGMSDGGAAVVDIAKRYLGVPYVYGGTNPATGLDCSGFTQLVYGQVGVDLPRVSWQQATAGRPVDSLADARPGDLLAFDRPVDHVGIYIGDGKMISAPRPGKNVEISSVYETPSAIRRVLPDTAASYAAPQSITSLATASLATAPLPALASFAGPLPAGTPFAAQFQSAEARTGVPARVLAAVAKAESGYRADAVSSSGARGLMQFMPATASGMGVNPLDPASAIDGAAKLLKSHLKEFGTLPLAIAAYNAGQGSVRKYGGIPPFAETRKYVDTIMTSLRSAA